MSREERKAVREQRREERISHVKDIMTGMNSWQNDAKNWKWFMIPFCVMMAVIFLSKAGEDVVVPVMGMLAVTAWIYIPFYFSHRRKLAKQEAETKQLEQPPTTVNDAEFNRMKERLENLETVLCNLDREINTQLQESINLNKNPLSLTQAGNSQMPTTFLNVASALEERYQVMRELGRGGMGIVFQAYDKQLNEPVAIKILSPFLSNDSEALERLKREVSAARRVTHSNVIRIHDIGETKGLHYVSMEYFPGDNLKDYLRRNRNLSFMQAYQIASQICEGVEAAHRQGVVHRDLKPQNVIIDARNQIKIIDFGLAHSAHLKGMTATGLIMGTPEYMSPEQVSGTKVDERTDMYSLGVILYELFTGRVPFTGDSAIAIGFMQMKDPPPPPTGVNPQLSPQIEAVILRALEKDPVRRYQTIAELRSDLEKAVFSPAQGKAEEAEIGKSIKVSIRESQKLSRN
jgi:serine/threonine-protein kinase